MKIGVNSRIYQESNTGIAHYIEGLYRAIQKIDQKNQYLFLQTNNQKKLGPTRTVKSSPGFLNDVLFDNARINKLINQNQIDVFHGPSFVLPYRKLPTVKYVVTVHDLSFRIYPKNQPRFFNWYYRFAVAHSVRQADAIIVDSESTSRDLQKLYRINPAKISVVYLGVSDYFKKKGSSQPPVAGKYFLTLSTHAKRKNTAGVIRAMGQSPLLRQLKFVVVGLIKDKPLRKLKALVRKYKLSSQVIFTGYVPRQKLRSLYRHAEFMVYPSFYEGFGLPALEAMACRCPVITSNTSSLPEINPNKHWRLDPNNIGVISQKMEEMLNISKEQRQQLIEQNLQHIQRFSWERSARQMQKIFEKLRS